jgi:hypothetical protein
MMSMGVMGIAPALLLTVLLAGSQVAAASDPVLLWASQPTWGNETVLLWGAGLGGVSNVTVQVDTTSSSPPPSALPAHAFDASDSALKVTLPHALPDGRYTLCVHGASAACIKLNSPDAWWLRGDVNQSHATAGTGWIRIFGRNFGDLSDAEPSRLPPVQLQLCPGAVWPCPYQGEVTTLTAANGSSNDAFFLLPGSITIGTFTLGLESGGAVFPLNHTIHVASTGTPQGAWAAAPAGSQQRIIDVNTTEQLFAALNTTAAEGGGVILLGHGTYQIPANQSISLPPFTVLRGATNAAGASLATLRFDVRPCGEHASCSNPLPAASVPSYFIGGNATFAVEDMTIYVLGLYNMIIRDSEQSSYVRIARVRIRADYFFRFGERRSFGAILLQKTIIAFAKARSAGHT